MGVTHAEDKRSMTGRGSEYAWVLLLLNFLEHLKYKMEKGGSDIR